MLLGRRALAPGKTDDPARLRIGEAHQLDAAPRPDAGFEFHAGNGSRSECSSRISGQRRQHIRRDRRGDAEMQRSDTPPCRRAKSTMSRISVRTRAARPAISRRLRQNDTATARCKSWTPSSSSSSWICIESAGTALPPSRSSSSCRGGGQIKAFPIPPQFRVLVSQTVIS